MPIGSWARRAGIRLADRLRFWRPLHEAAAILYLGIYIVASAGRFRRGVPRHQRHLFRAARATRAARIRSLIRGALSPWLEAAAPAPAVQRRSAGSGPEEVVRAVLPLKAPGDVEKGVLFAGNEMPWPALQRVAERTRLFEEYQLVALSAWSPPAYEKLVQFAGLSTDAVLIGISNPDDLEGYRLLAPAIAPLPLMACDWINPDDFRPRARSSRDVDILMVAGWGRYKRHWLLFEALRGLRRDLNVVLIGSESAGRTVDDIKAEARLFGVRQELTFLSNLPVEEVNDYQSRARASVIFSNREGACVAVTESFFADSPVGMMRDAHVGAKTHINAATGALFSRTGLPRQLGDFLETSDGFRARAWALEHISCHRSSSVLNDVLRRRAIAADRRWTRDIAPLFRRYFTPRYLHREDATALAPAVEALRRDYGLTLAPAPDAP